MGKETRHKMKRGFLWVTGVLFLVSLAGQFYFSWQVYAQEQEEHGQPLETRDYVNETMKDVLENWQSEFLQLCWQVAGLAFLLYVGSPQSKEEEERVDEKLNRLLEKAYGKEEGQRIQAELDEKFPKK